MAKYELLFNDLTLLSVELENRINSNLKRQEKIRTKQNNLDVKVDNLNAEKNKKIEIYKTLVNFDKLKKEGFIEALKDAAVVSGLTFVLFEIMAISLSIGMGEVFWHGIFSTLPVSLAVGEFETVIKYLKNTKKIRDIDKKYGNLVDVSPIIISNYDKQIHWAYEEKDDLQIELQSTIDEEKHLNEQLEKCDKLLDVLENRITEINHICRDDQDCIDDVYDADFDVQEALKLVRETKNV